MLVSDEPGVAVPGFCRDCLRSFDKPLSRCARCGKRRLLVHPELNTLSIAHLDCDAFYAAVEKHDDPSLAAKPVIVGGGRRGVVLTACYVARTFGVRSAMPMFQALQLCPNPAIVKPRMARYLEVSRSVRALMRELTPLVEPLSLDEAYLDLSGTELLHGTPPAATLAALALRIERKTGITVSIGLSFNKFLAKLASDLDKPRGFAVIGQAEAKTFLRDKPVSLMRGAGPALQAQLARDGLTRIGQLQDASAADLAKRYGGTGLWLHTLANAEDTRGVDPTGETKSISSETTFDADVKALSELEAILWRQCERVGTRAKACGLGGRTVVLKLKTTRFRVRTRSVSLDAPTQLADRIFRAARDLLRREADGTPFRLLGVGLHNICSEAHCDPPDLVDASSRKRASAEYAMDSVRARFGEAAVGKGRGLRVRKRAEV
ncbi:MAG: DNA polymerase IV [Alphaproteobacteria bacterium]|nr:DNA polymerase IV [Alphaproteobacteria bacterium]